MYPKNNRNKYDHGMFVKLLFIAGNELDRNNNTPFTTKDHDNDGGNCGVRYHGGWWYVGLVYVRCANTNLNGPYVAEQATNVSAMYWIGWPTSYMYYSLKKTTIMIKRM